MLRRSASLPALVAKDDTKTDPISDQIQRTRRKRSQTAYCMSYLNEQRAKTVEDLEKALLVKKKSINDLRKINKALLNNFHKKPHVIMSTLQAQLTAVHAEINNKANMASNTFMNEHDKAVILKDLLATCRIERSESFFRNISEDLMDCYFKRLEKKRGPNVLSDNSISLQRRVIQLSREVEELRSDVERTRKRLHDETAAYNDEVDRETGQIQNLQKQISSLKAQRESLKQNTATMERNLQEMQLLKVNDEAEIEELKETAANVTENGIRVKEEMKQKSKLLKDIKASTRRLKREIWETEKMRAQYKQEQEITKELMEHNKALTQGLTLEVTEGRELIENAFSEYNKDLVNILEQAKHYQSKNVSLVYQGEQPTVEDDTAEYFPSCNDPNTGDNSLGDYMRMMFIRNLYSQIIQRASISFDDKDIWTDIKMHLKEIVDSENGIALIKQQRMILGKACKAGYRKKQLYEIKQKLHEIENKLLTSLKSVVLPKESVEAKDIGNTLEDLYQGFINKLE